MGGWDDTLHRLPQLCHKHARMYTQTETAELSPWRAWRSKPSRRARTTPWRSRQMGAAYGAGDVGARASWALAAAAALPTTLGRIEERRARR